MPDNESFLVPLDAPTPRRRRPDDNDPNRQALANPRVKSFLDKIGKSEGADYNTLVGGRKINDLSRHPNTVGLRTSAGPSTAFGKYQIVGTTDRSKLAKYKDLDYTPENQDVRAVELLRQTKALDALNAGDETTAMKRAGREWASIPGSPLPGRKNTAAWRQQQASNDSFLVPLDQPAPSAQPKTPEDSFLVPLDVAPEAPPEVGASVTAPIPRRARPKRNAIQNAINLGMGVTEQAARNSAGPARLPVNPSKIEVRKPFTFNAPSDEQLKADLRRKVAAEVSQKGLLNQPSLVGPELEREVESRFEQYKQARAQDAEMARTGPSMGGRRKGRFETIQQAIAPYTPGLQSLDTPMGIKTDLPRGIARGLTLGAIGNEREISPEEKLINPNAETERNVAGLAGEMAAGFVPYVGAGKLLSKVPALAKGTRGARIAHDSALFGGVGAAREGIHSAKTGEDFNVASVAIDSLLGAATGGIAGVNPGIKRQLFAFVAPMAVSDIARGVPPEEAAQNAVTNLIFGLHSGAAPKGMSARRFGQLRKELGGSRITEIKNAFDEIARKGEQRGSETPSRLPQEISDLQRGAADVTADTAGSGTGGAAVQETSPTLQRFQHLQFGEVEALADQSGARPGRVKVAEVSDPTKQHFVKKADLQGRGNSRMIPLKGEVPAAVQEAEQRTVRRAFDEIKAKETPAEVSVTPPAEAAPQVEPTASQPKRTLSQVAAEVKGQRERGELTTVERVSLEKESQSLKQARESLASQERVYRSGEGTVEGAGKIANDIAAQRAEVEARLSEIEGRLRPGMAEKGAINPLIEKRDAANAELRAKFDKMTPEEKVDALHKMDTELKTNPVSNMPNKRAYEEAPKKEIQVFSDIDGLKHINDTYGHGYGDKLIQAKAEILKDEKLDSSHISGDEFYHQFDTVAEARAAMERAKERLARSEIDIIQPDGSIKTIKGASFSYGIGHESKRIPDVHPGEAALKADKAAREATGQRSSERGGRPSELVETVSQRQQDTGSQSRAETGEVTPRPRPKPSTPSSQVAQPPVKETSRPKPASEDALRRTENLTGSGVHDLAEVILRVPEWKSRVLSEIGEGAEALPYVNSDVLKFRTKSGDQVSVENVYGTGKTPTVGTKHDGLVIERVPALKTPTASQARSEVVQSDQPVKKGEPKNAPDQELGARKTSESGKGVAGDTLKGESAAPSKLESANIEAKAKLDALGPEPPKPSGEKQHFGSRGREAADPAEVARYDAEVRAHNTWKRKYGKLKKAEVAASNAAFYEKQNAPSLVKSAAAREAERLAHEAAGGESRGSGGPNTQPLIDQIILRGWDAYAKAKPKFEDWAREIRKEFGEKAEPHLKKIYSQLSGAPEVNEPSRPRQREKVTEKTSIKNEATEELRNDLGLLEVEAPERKSFQQSIDNALAKGLDKKAEQIADEVINGKKPDGINDEEAAGIQHRIRELENRYEELHAKDKGNPELAKIEATLDKLTEATKKGGTPIARSLAFRRSTIDKDFKLISLIRRAKEAKGRDLTPQERTRYEEIVKERDKAVAERDTALEQLHAKQLQKELDKAARVKTREGKKETLDKEAVMIKENIAAEFARLRSQQSGTFSMGGLGSLDPNGVITKNLLKYARNRAEAVVGLKAEALIDEAHSLVKDFGINRRQVAEALSGYGRVPVDKRSEAAKKLAEIRAEINTLLTSEDIDTGKRSPRPEGPRKSEARSSGQPLEGPKLGDVRKVPMEGPRKSEASQSGQPLEGPKLGDVRKLPAEGPKLSESTERVAGPKYDLVRNQKRFNDLVKQEAEWERKFNEREFEPKPKAEPYPYNSDVRRAEDRVRIAEAKFNREMQRSAPGHQFRNASGVIKAWLLSGPPTQVMNITGTGSYQIFREVARLPAAIADGVWSAGRQAAGLPAQRGITGPSPSAMLDSVVQSWKVGGREAVEILRHGATKEQMERHQFQEIDFGVNTGRKTIDQGVKIVELAHNVVFRFMSASDRVFYQGVYKRNLIDRAKVQALNEGVSDVKARTKELTENPTERLDADAKLDALVSTFNNSNWLSSKIKRARSAVIEKESLMSKKNAERLNAAENLALDFILPFDRTPTNVVSRIVEASPLGYMKNAGQLISAAMRKTMPVEHQRQMMQTFGNATTGTALMGLGWYLADKAKGLIQIDDYDVWLTIPRLPKINLRTASPAGNILAMGARLRKAHQEEGSWGEYVKPVTREAANIPILRATNPLSDVARDPERSLPKTAGRFASMMIPFSGLSKWVAEATDREKDGQASKVPFAGEAVPRKPESFMDALKVKIPGARQTVEKDWKKAQKGPSKFPSVRPGTVNVGKASVGKARVGARQ